MNYDPYQGDINKVPPHERDGDGFAWAPLLVIIALVVAAIYMFPAERPNSPGGQAERVTQSTQPSP